MAQKSADNSIREQVQTMAREIAKRLHGKGPLPLESLKQEFAAQGGIIVDWAIGWLMQEDEIELSAAASSYSIRRKEPDTSGVFI